MDESGFDALTRAFTNARSRRGALSALLGGTVGLLGLADTTARKHGASARPRNRVRRVKKRKHGKCKGKQLNGRGQDARPGPGRVRTGAAYQ